MPHSAITERYADRDNQFWDSLRTGEIPASSRLLGWELLDIDPDAGTSEVAFTVDDRFTNPAGHIQGGFVAAMLDEAIGPALVAMLPPKTFAPTASLHVTYLAPALPGRLYGRAKVIRKGGTLAFITGELTREDGTVVATATATHAIRELR